MSQVSQQEEALAFERLLLSAGRTEALPSERTEVALLRFAASIGALQDAGSAVSGDPTSSASAGSWVRLATTAKWLGLGFVAGGVAMFGWLQHEPRLVEGRALQVTPIATALPTATPSTAPASPETQQLVQTSKPPPAAPARAKQRERVPSVDALPSPSASSGSDLAAEVAALDGIRTALAIGAWQDAEKQSEAYRRTFPRGALRSEAEVLAIEGLVEQGRKQAAVDAGERFIAGHPRDPQVARVRVLIESP